jgi:formylglycine-generating enzyme required for sulfatase activity
VEPGCFIMGAPRDEPGAGRVSNVQVQVTLTRPFEIGRTEVTREAWSATGWPLPMRNVPVGEGACEDPTCPVGNVSFLDAIRYANWLSEKEQLDPCYVIEGCSGEVGVSLECTTVQWAAASGYECSGYRLPMEAEWEYAARAGTSTAFYTGEAVSTQLNECVPEPALEAVAWYCNNSGERAHPVAQKQANALGLHDMLGNLYEWCNDYRDGLGYGEGPLIDPPGQLTPGRDLLPAALPNGEDGRTHARVLRGGDYVLPGDACTAADRGASGPSHTSSAALGFRLVRSLAR